MGVATPTIDPGNAAYSPEWMPAQAEKYPELAELLNLLADYPAAMNKLNRPRLNPKHGVFQ